MFFLSLIYISAIALLAAEPANKTSAPVVVELFTSQSCSSCPPAEAILRDLSTRDDILALEWHVDYWDNLRAGSHGKWKDPYSSPAFTERQRSYNRALRGTRAVYTPQIIINGREETVGSRRGEIEGLIKNGARAQAEITAISANRKIEFSMTAPPAEVILVTFLTSAVTDVRRGENQGLQLAEAHIVTDSQKLGIIQNGRASFSVTAPKAGFGCALLVQEENTGRIYGGAYCPS